MSAMRLLILGTGSMAKAHALAFAAETDIQIVAAVEPNAERLASFSDEHNIPNRFANIEAAIAWGQFDAAANVNLDRLAARLSEFVDLGGVRFGGTAAVTLQTGPRPDGKTTASGLLRLVNFSFTDGQGRDLHEKELTAEFQAVGAIGSNPEIRLDQATATIAAATMVVLGSLAADLLARLAAPRIRRA